MQWQPPTRETRHPALTDADEPDASTDRPDAQAIKRRSGIGAEYEAEKAQTKDGAGGGPECCNMRPYLCDGRGLDQDGAGGGPRGRGMRLLKIEEARTRMRVRDDSFE